MLRKGATSKPYSRAHSIDGFHIHKMLRENLWDLNKKNKQVSDVWTHQVGKYRRSRVSLGCHFLLWLRCSIERGATGTYFELWALAQPRRRFQVLMAQRKSKRHCQTTTILEYIRMKDLTPDQAHKSLHFQRHFIKLYNPSKVPHKLKPGWISIQFTQF